MPKYYDRVEITIPGFYSGVKATLVGWNEDSGFFQYELQLPHGQILEATLDQFKVI
jgi:hypothetical protein